MSTNPDDFMPALDAADDEFTMPLPDAPAETEPAPAAEAAPAEPAPAPAAAPRDPATGQFLPQPPKSMPDPLKAAEAAVTPEPAKEEPRVIPLAAHVEERKRWQQEVQDLRDRLGRLEKPPAPPEPEPDFLEDPKGYVDAKVAKATESVQQVQQVAEVGAQSAQLLQFRQHLATLEHQAVSQHTDYYEALNHIRGARIAQLTELHPQASEQQIMQQIEVEELQASAAMLQQGRNPTEAFYKMAKTVYGYAPKAPAAAVAAAPVPAAPAPPAGVKVGDPASTLGPSGTGIADADAQELGDEYTKDILGEALKERFRR